MAKKTPNDALNQILLTLPEAAQPIIRQALASAPPDVRRELVSQLDALQKLTNNNPAAYAELLSMVKRLASPAVAPLSKIAIVGSINVGKSTLFNALLAGTAEKAAVSSVPGTTKENQHGQVGLFSLVDTPGFNHGAESGAQESRNALDACEESDFIIALFDASRGITTDDRKLYGYVTTLDKPYIVAFNKIDLIDPKERKAIIASCAATLGLHPDEVNPISADKSKGIDQLLLAVAAHEPRLLGELGKNIPNLRSKLAWQAIRRSAIAAAVISLSPLPFVDFIPLTALQITMVITISRIYDQPLSKARAFELLGSFGMSLAGRSVFQQLLKLGGPPGWAISASVATATTVAIGYCIINWFAKGIKPTSSVLSELGKKLQQRLLSLVIFKKNKRPTKKLLKEDLSTSIEHITQDLCDYDVPQELSSTEKGQDYEI